MGDTLSDAEEKLLRTTVKGLSRAIILWLLSRRKMCGYEIIKEIYNLTDLKFTSGVIYPILYELEEKGLIKGEWTSKGRRNIKYYSITKNGLNILENLRALFSKSLRQIIENFIFDEDERNLP